MGLEAASFISNLQADNPVPNDKRAQGDDHIRLIKQVLKNTFPNANKAEYFASTTAIVTASFAVSAATDAKKIFLVNAASAALTVTLPAKAAVADGFSVTVYKTDTSANSVTIAPNSSDAILGGTFVLRKAYQAVTVIWSAINDMWLIVSDGLVTLIPPAIVVSDNLTIASSDDRGVRRISAAGSARTVTLPNGLPAGFMVTVIKSDNTTNLVTLDATESGGINGAATLQLFNKYQSAVLLYTGTDWLNLTGGVDTVPVGGWIGWNEETPPSNKWLFPEGQAISRSVYAELYARWGVKFGAGNGSTTFNMPDYRGRFLRVWANGAATDPDRASRLSRGDGTVGDKIGTYQNDALQSHTHNTPAIPGTDTFHFDAGGGSNGYLTGSNVYTTTSPTNARLSSETRSTNVAVGIIYKVLP